MNCDTTRELFSDYFDGGLTAEERRGIEAHLHGCTVCGAEYRHFTTSLQVLHESRPLETTQVFLANVRSLAAAHLERRELYTDTGLDGPKVEIRNVLPAWVPWSLAAAVLVAFGFGYFSSGPRRGEEYQALLRAIEEAKRKPPERVEIPVKVDEEEILARHGIIRVAGVPIAKSMKDDFDRGKVCLAGKMMEPAEAAKLLAEKFPPAVVPVPPVAQAPSVEEILDKAGFTRVGEVPVSRESVERWARGEVQVGVNEWRKAGDFKADVMREHNLVEVRGKLMTREQAESIQAQQFVRRPDAAPAVNEVTRVLEGLEIGPPMNFKGITLYPLLSAAAAAAGEAPFKTLRDALGTGKVEIVDSGVLFSAQIRNGLDADVLLLAGEILTGGRCARVVAEDTLAPRKKTSAVPVFCVEPGAWRSGDRFEKSSGHYIAPPSMRRSLAAEQGQGAIWSMLARRLEKGRAGQADLFRKHVEAIAEARSYFAELPRREAAAVGVAVAMGDGLDLIEIFPSRALFAACFDRLVAGAALDSLERPAGRAAPAFPNSVKGVKQLLESAFFFTYESRADGYGLRREEGWAGRACVTPAGLHHALFFTAGTTEGERRTATGAPKEKLARALAEYEKRMAESGPSGKIATLKELASIGAPEVVPLLVKHLGETEAAVRRAAIRELGGTGDRRAAEELLKLLGKSRSDGTIYAEIVRALARLGEEEAIEPLLRQADMGDAELARLVVMALPELLLQARSRDLLERATGRLVAMYAAADAAVRGEAVDPMTKSLKPEEARPLAEAARSALRQLTGHDFDKPAGYTGWWNVRENREKFLKERTGK